jgi:lipid II:glycine glycyltransferase (peptidoglycan interpeptide bridge formation enzyme)
MAVALDGDAGEAWERIAKKTRQRIGSARRRGLVVRRFDARGEGAADENGGVARPPTPLLEEAAAAVLGPFHALLESTGTRRGFAIGSRAGSVEWWLAALRAGHLVYLEVRDAVPDDDWTDPAGMLLGGAIFFRQGGRLTYGHSGDRTDLRAVHPGVVHLVLWEALRLAATEGASELDLGGVDVAGARGIPAEGDPMWGLYEFKRAFGGEWIDLAGAHERVARPRRYAAGRALAAASRRIPGAGRG